MLATGRIKRLGVGVATAVGLALGGAALAGAAQNPSASETDQTQDPSYGSSISAPEKDYGSEAEESKALQDLATISPQQARDAALAQVPGEAGKTELENENGSIVYSVEITDSSGAAHDMKVDAGNGRVVHQENEAGENEAGENEANAEAGENEAGENEAGENEANAEAGENEANEAANDK